MLGGIGNVRLGVFLIGLHRRANRFCPRQWMLDVFHTLILFARAWARVGDDIADNFDSAG